MAGLGFKDFQVGEVLTSSDVDGYLMQQTVMRFADSGARGSALGTAPGTAVALAEGMVSYLDDVDRLEFYNGTEWTGAGKVLQVVWAQSTAQQTSSSSTFVDVTDLTVDITPTSTTSTILVTVHLQMSAENQDALATILRNSTDITNGGSGTHLGFAMTVAERAQTLSFQSLDAPASTSTLTYKVQARAHSGLSSPVWYVNDRASGTFGLISSISAMEVSA